MAVTQPEEMNRAFAEAYNAGSMERLLALYEPGAVLVSRPGQRAVGHQAIRAALGELLALGGTMRSENRYCLVLDDLALLRAEFHLVGTDPGGHPVEVLGASAEVVRRQLNGTWRYAIDHPFGADPDDSARL